MVRVSPRLIMRGRGHKIPTLMARDLTLLMLLMILVFSTPRWKRRWRRAFQLRCGVTFATLPLKVIQTTVGRPFYLSRVVMILTFNGVMIPITFRIVRLLGKWVVIMKTPVVLISRLRFRKRVLLMTEFPSVTVVVDMVTTLVIPCFGSPRR